MSAPPPTIAFVRYPGRRGAIWLKEAAAMLSAARVPWLMLLLVYYLIQLMVSVIPVVGPLAMMVLRPVFTVGFLAAAWTQERGGDAARSGTCSAASARICGRCLPIGVVLIVGHDARGAGDGARRRRRAARRDHVQRASRTKRWWPIRASKAAMLLAILCALPTLLAVWFAPALVVFQDCGARQALLTSLRAALANWRPVAVYGLLLFFCGAVLPGIAIAIIALLVPPAVGAVRDRADRRALRVPVRRRAGDLRLRRLPRHLSRRRGQRRRPESSPAERLPARLIDVRALRDRRVPA